jgi:tetratricopeptide (TPR) repeat protein
VTSYVKIGRNKVLNRIVKLKQTVIGGMLLVTAVASSALSIGRARGGAWIGQVLDVTIPVRLETGEDGGGLCFEADVFHGDLKVDSRNVRIVAEALPGTAEGREVAVRVRSSTIVDEPVVTIYFKVGCDQKITRRLVLLAELPTETSSAIAAAPLPTLPVPSLTAPAPAPATVTPAARPAPAPAPASNAASSRLPSTEGQPKRPARAPRPAPAPRPAVAPAVEAPVAAPAPAAATPVATPKTTIKPEARPTEAPKPRLKLDPVEVAPVRDPSLRSSTTLSSEENADKRAEASAAWRSINAQPEDMLRESERLQQLEASLNALRSQMMQNQTNISDLKNQLEQARGERYANPLVYGLAALLLAALGAAGFFWQRSRRAGASRAADWWRDVDHRSPATVQVPPNAPGAPGVGAEPVVPPQHRRVPPAVVEPTVRTRVPPAAPVMAPAAEVSQPVGALDLDLGFDDPTPAAGPAHSTPLFQNSTLPRRLQTDFASSFGGSGRSVNTEELFDIHQQADFFLSLGQHDQAIGVLMAHIRENPETSALAYLDLLRIYHQLQRRDDFNKLRDDFHNVFNAGVPEFDAFSETGPGLEAYPETLARITALWGSADGITLVEDLIFRRPDADEAAQTFDLEAYKELLLLFAVALEVSEGDDEGFVVSGPDSAFASMGAAPLTVPPTLDDEPATVPPEASVSLPPLPELDSLPSSTGGSVDIDLVLSDSMVAPIESLPKARPPQAAAPVDNSIEFDLFDPSAEAPKKK